MHQRGRGGAGGVITRLACHAARAKIDACPGCGGIWLDKGEWEGREGPKANGWLQQFFDGLMASKHARF